MPDQSPQDCSESKTESAPKNKSWKKFRPAWFSDAFAGYLCLSCSTLLWVIGGALLNSHPKPIRMAWGFIFGGVCFFAFAARCWAINHRKRQVENKMPQWTPFALLLGIIFVGLIVSGFAIWQEHPSQPIEMSSPVVVPNRIQLGDGKVSRESVIDVFNPNDFPVYLTTLKIDTPRSPKTETVNIRLSAIPDTDRMTSKQGSTDEASINFDDEAGNHHFVIFINLPAKTHRRFNMMGSVGSTNWSEFSIIDYRKDYSLSHKSTNDTQWDIALSDSKIWKFLPKWLGTPTNFSIEIEHTPTPKKTN